MVRLAVQFLGIRYGASSMVLGLYGTVSAGAYGLMSLVSGRASDRFGRRIAPLFISIVALVWLVLGAQKTALGVLLLLPLFTGALAFFWPPVQAWMGDLVGGTGKLHRVLGIFNVLWTTGLMLGPALCGYLWVKDTYAPFAVGAVMVWAGAAAMMLIPVLRRGRDAAHLLQEHADEAEHVDVRADRYLVLAWAANFVGYSSVGVVRSLFPKLAVELGFSEVVTGWITAAFYCGQLLAFAALRQTTAWQYRRLPLAIGMAAGAVGMGGAYLGHSPATYVAAFLVGGVAVGFAYVGSLFYSLSAPQSRRGRRCGVHEMMVGAGGSLGPLLAGSVAMHYGVRASFGVQTLVFVAAMVLLVGWTVAGRLRSST
jgi:MFS family permease